MQAAFALYNCNSCLILWLLHLLPCANSYTFFLSLSLPRQSDSHFIKEGTCFSTLSHGFSENFCSLEKYTESFVSTGFQVPVQWKRILKWCLLCIPFLQTSVCNSPADLHRGPQDVLWVAMISPVFRDRAAWHLCKTNSDSNKSHGWLINNTKPSDENGKAQCCSDPLRLLFLNVTCLFHWNEHVMKVQKKWH